MRREEAASSRQATAAICYSTDKTVAATQDLNLFVTLRPLVATRPCPRAGSPESHRAAAAAILAGWETRLRDQPFLFGGRPTLADRAIAPFVRQFAHTDLAWFQAQPWPGLQAWLTEFLDSAVLAQVMTRFRPCHAGAPPSVLPEAWHAVARQEIWPLAGFLTRAASHATIGCPNFLIRLHSGHLWTVLGGYVTLLQVPPRFFASQPVSQAFQVPMAGNDCAFPPSAESKEFPHGSPDPAGSGPA